MHAKTAPDCNCISPHCSLLTAQVCLELVRLQLCYDRCWVHVWLLSCTTKQVSAHHQCCVTRRVHAWLHELNRQGRAREVLEHLQQTQWAFTPAVAADLLQAAARSGYLDSLAQGGPARCAFRCMNSQLASWHDRLQGLLE